MSQVNILCNKCDVCGHSWIPQPGVTYSHCTSGKCRSRKWNSGAPQGGARPPKPSLVGSSPTAPAKVFQREDGSYHTDANEYAIAMKNLARPTPQRQVCKECSALGGLHARGCKLAK